MSPRTRRTSDEGVGAPRPDERTENRNADRSSARRRNLPKAGSAPWRAAQHLARVRSRDAGDERNAFGAVRRARGALRRVETPFVAS